MGRSAGETTHRRARLRAGAGLALAAAVCAWVPAEPASAKPSWATGSTRRVPNASVYQCLTCHTSDSPEGCGSECNAFGHAFQSNGNAWNATLAAGDADADSFPSGWELQDPGGAWTTPAADPGSPALVSAPGNAASQPPRVSVDPVAIEHAEIAGTDGMESFAVHNSGGLCAGNPNGPCGFGFDVASDVAWVSPDPVSGQVTADPALIDLWFASDALFPGDYDGTVTVSAADVMGSPQAIPVTLTVPEPSSLALRAGALLSLAVVARRPRRSTGRVRAAT
jgi:hypothetical protein